MSSRDPSRFEPSSSPQGVKIGGSVTNVKVEHSPGPPGKGLPGLPGEDGLPGIKGDKGDPGPAGLDYTFVFDQPSASTYWVIDHASGKHPSVVVVDTTGRSVRGELKYPTLDRVTITFSVPLSGQAYLN